MSQCSQNGKRVYKISADDFAEARIRASKVISEGRKGIKFSEEHIKHLCGHGKSVVNITTGEEFSSIKEAALSVGLKSPSKIIEVCKGKANSAGRDRNNNPCIWRYKGEEDKNFGLNTFYIQRKIKCIETGEIYESIREASRETGIGQVTIRNDCKHKTSRQKIKRLHFEYFE